MLYSVGCNGHHQEKSVVWNIADVASETSHDVGWICTPTPRNRGRRLC